MTNRQKIVLTVVLCAIASACQVGCAVKNPICLWNCGDEIGNVESH